MLFILAQTSVNQCISHIMAHLSPPNPTSYHFSTPLVFTDRLFVTLTHTLSIVIKKLNKMTIVSRIPGLRLLKVKQNCFNPKSKQAHGATMI